MTFTLALILIIVVSLANLVLLVLLLRRTAPASEETVITELRFGREESRAGAGELRGEIQRVDETLRRTLAEHAQLQQAHQAGLSAQLGLLIEGSRTANDAQRAMLDGRIRDLQEGTDRRLGEMRGELGAGLRGSAEGMTAALERLSTAQDRSLAGMTEQLKTLARASQEALDRIRGDLTSGLRDSAEAAAASLERTRAAQEHALAGMTGQLKDLARTNQEALDRMRGELSSGLKESTQAAEAALERTRAAQDRSLTGMSEQLKELARTNQEALDRMRGALDVRVRELAEGNERKLEEMRRTVDEKLHEALEKRLGESFKQVSEHLESVHKGLGEMQSLASGVGDLKRVLTNVKTRGTWAEVQLGAILEQILTPGQFERNVRIKADRDERVEFAVCLPGPKDDPGARLLLPIDSKFPHEDYARLQTAAETGDVEGVGTATKALLQTMRVSAREIHDKYVDPPGTTDFAIMFLATEGLYAEALRQPGFLEELLQQYRIVLAGPTTLSALLNSLRMGFQTLAVEKRAAEVWQVLGGVKTEFRRFGTVLEKIQQQLQRASNTLQETGQRTRAMERQLRGVEELGPVDSARILRLPGLPALESGEGDAPEDAFVEPGLDRDASGEAR